MSQDTDIKIKNIKKRDGTIVSFNKGKIANAIFKAVREVGGSDRAESDRLASVVASILEGRMQGGEKMPTVEEVQDLVEKVLIEEGHAKVAKAYIIYRHKHAEIRTTKDMLGVKDELKLPVNTIKVLASRYLIKDEDGKVVETTKELFGRVSKGVAIADKLYGKTDAEVEDLAQQFYDMMTSFDFMPNSPTIMNAGTELGQLSACFVIPVEDNLEGIFDAVKHQAMIHKTGGGTGFSFTRLRPKGDRVKGTFGVSSGPVSFMKIFDAATAEIKQGGKRRGANMGILRVDHPDILEFIMLKEKEGVLSNFNISVAITDKFMNAVKSGEDYDLVNPRNNKPHGRLNARAVWNLIVTMAWKTGDPGIVFIDRINNTASNPVPSVGPVESTNPCGEQPLYPYDSCNLGSINLGKMVKDGEIDWEKLRTTTRLGVHFLDNVIDANKYPLIEIEMMSKRVRRIGLGVMGFADMLIKLGIPYNSPYALKVAESVMKFVTDEGRQMSVELAKDRGSFPEFKNSIWAKMGYECMRNSTVTTIAPTGTISIIAGGCSQGIEPLFSIAYVRAVGGSLGHDLVEVSPLFEKMAIQEGFHSEDLLRKIAQLPSIQNLEGVPADLRKLFVTAFDVSPEWHVRVQAAFQKYTDNAVSKTINFSNFATPHDIEKAYTLSYDLGCKGITVYRDGSKSFQILNVGAATQPQTVSVPVTEEGYIKETVRCEGCSSS
ncbi:MAG: adenosylcobalamin-dependent ribonucleoside-diphosphate reductase [Candidatus Aenigmarchaeota archaeon]|nr:adenosylcobalamin-dependent ribonucleoside-diphosphate reductase [Candidatus Aenigmarchaeota archaeon]